MAQQLLSEFHIHAERPKIRGKAVPEGVEPDRLIGDPRSQ
jgi:hypothetical protein